MASCVNGSTVSGTVDASFWSGDMWKKTKVKCGTLSLNTHTIQHVDLYVMEKAATQEALVCLCLVVSNSVLSLLKQLLMPVTSS